MSFDSGFLGGQQWLCPNLFMEELAGTQASSNSTPCPPTCVQAMLAA